MYLFGIGWTKEHSSIVNFMFRKINVVKRDIKVQRLRDGGGRYIAKIRTPIPLSVILIRLISFSGVRLAPTIFPFNFGYSNMILLIKHISPHFLYNEMFPIGFPTFNIL